MNNDFRLPRPLAFLSLLSLLLFIFVLSSMTLTPARADDTPAPASVAIVGNLQSELGCPGDWQPECSNSELVYDGADDVWQDTFAVPGGSWEYKAALNDSWDENYGQNATRNGANIPLSLGAETDVKFYYDHKSHWVTDNVNAVIATVPGSFQSELGCPGDWAPDCLRSWLQDPDGDGIYEFTTTAIPAGSYEAKVAIDEGWAENYGAGGEPNGSNISFTVAADENEVRFIYDPATHILTINTAAGAGHDNDVWWNDLGHDSRDTLYRTPEGAVPAGTPVTLRLRAASGDLTAARVRLWNDRGDFQQLLEMSRVADDETYEWWEASVPASSQPTIYWYRFIAIDGTATAYYEDDDARDGGWGQTFGSSPDNSWQLTVYDPSFQTPDWVKNGIIYQIFPDRFRDGNPGNNTPPGSFHYDLPDGSIVRSNGTDWNTPICDPRDEDSGCFQKYGENFYGGDLEGILAQLDYLQSIGVTVIYFNPIFESPSNHKYDTTDFSVIDDNFGDLATFQMLADEAHTRGIRIVLDGVFNHSSSDSIYFDRYGQYDSLGACESEASDYRDWYLFSPASPPGTGDCAGDAHYESWFGFDSLPKLNSGNGEVRDYFWAAPGAIGRYWLQWADGWRLDVGGDVDPGVTNDPTNDYWEGFRDAVHEANPDAYIVGEEWGMATAWTLGEEWDATMNYQFSSAVLSFWRDTPFVDNDHNTGSSAGVLTPLSPSQLDARLHNLEERYPPEAFYAMMNLLGSHDTNRALFMLDENSGLNDAGLYENPNYDWSDAITRLKGVWLLQMTLPGAPTTYYGDEVGLVGPVTYDGSTWQDDPYNRLPFPWLDESGTPYYTHLQTAAGQDTLRNHFTLLTGARNDHPALRTGSFDTLLVDDANNLYAYGRLLSDYSDAAVVIVNRAGNAQSVIVDVAGYLPVGAQFTDVLNGGSYTVDGNGQLSVPGVPARSGALLVLSNTMAAPPEATTLSVTAVRNTEVDLEWTAVAGADSYDVYRSLVSGGGYTLLANVTGTNYTDTALTTATAYYYIVVARNDANGLVSDDSNEQAVVPAYDLTTAWYKLQWPPSIVHTISTQNRTEEIYGQIWIDGVTDQAGATPGLLAQVGFGPDGSAPTDPGWQWEPMSFNTDAGNNDEFSGTLLPDQLGEFDYATRYSGDGGQSWFYADLSGPGINGNPGALTVVAGDDTSAPAAPTNLTVTGTSNSSVSLSWDANSESDLAGYEVYRAAASGVDFSRIAQLGSAVTTYDDLSVTTGQSYDYYVVAYDTSFNRSAASNTVSAVAELRFVAVTFRIGVPAYTPGTVYVAGNVPQLGPWNPGLVPLTQVDATTWETTVNILDGTQLEYKFTRGNWETVEQWGTITGLANRSATISYGSDGTQLIENTATDWGNGPDIHKAVQFWSDPIVVDHSPTSGATEVLWDEIISVAWSEPMDPGATFAVTGDDLPVAGSFNYDAGTNTLTFTPDGGLAAGTTYVVTVSDQRDAQGNTQQVPAVWSFTTMTIQTHIGEIMADVEALVAAGILNKGQGNSLNVKLNGAIQKLDQGQPTAAVNQLNAFINEVNSYVTEGILTEVQGATLIDAAHAAIEQINNGS